MPHTRILVIDGDHPSHDRLVPFLEKKYSVAVAGGYSEGVAQALEHAPNLVVMRLPIEVAVGLDAIRRLRATQVTSRIPIVVLSADPRRETVVAAIQAGAADFVLDLNLNLNEFDVRIQRLFCSVLDRGTVAASIPRQQTEQPRLHPTRPPFSDAPQKPSVAADL